MAPIQPAQLALIAAALVFVYPFVIYPALLRLIPVRSRPRRELSRYPDAALIVCALNEESVLAEKIENSLALDYPGKLSVVVISDGSTDRTAEIARRYLPRIELIERPARRGKAANLNDAIAARSEEIIVLSDANVLYDGQAVRRLVEPFADAGVGAASGRVRLGNTFGAIRDSEERYYSIEWTLQELESELYSMIGADGAMYAIRRELFEPCPDDTIIEDFVIPMSVVRRGKRVVFAPDATADEQGVQSLREEFRRKVRIAAGAAQALVRGNGWPGRAPPVFWWMFVSHKLLRWLSPFIGCALLAGAALQWRWPPARLMLGGAGAVAALAFIRMISPWRGALPDGAFYFLFGQAAMAWGFLKGLVGRQSVLWAKTNR